MSLETMVERPQDPEIQLYPDAYQLIDNFETSETYQKALAQRIRELHQTRPDINYNDPSRHQR